MLEAVTSVLQTSQFVRPSAEQTSTVDSFAANPERVQRAAPQAPYISPYIAVDVNYDKAVLQIRNSETGDVEGQFPTQAQLEAQARSAARRQVEAQQQNAASAAPQTQAQSAQSPQAERPQAPPTGGSGSQGPTPQQQAAFVAAAQAGNSNASAVSLFA